MKIHPWEYAEVHMSLYFLSYPYSTKMELLLVQSVSYKVCMFIYLSNENYVLFNNNSVYIYF